ncbi:FliH/SctL family protein [Stappia sp.]|uniref:FliH/SctL family protein n=1 Tax=Stappia sp. TaxID=1870903 RepID=UPI003A9944CD
MTTRFASTEMKVNRFLFDRTFSEIEIAAREEDDDVHVEPEIPMMTVAEHEALMAAAVETARAQGRAEAQATQAQTEEARLSQEARRLADEVSQLVEHLDTDQARLEKDAVALSFLVARRLCAHLVAREPLGEVVALISECLGPLRRAPHVVIRVREADLAALKERVDPLVSEKGFEGRLVFLGEPDIAAGDCRIEWADGGIVRDRRAIEKQVDQAAKRYFEARRNGKAGPTASIRDAAEERDET